jgi:hypothetical protein
LAEDAAQYGWSVRYLEKIVQCIKNDTLPVEHRRDCTILGKDQAEAHDLDATEISIRIAEALEVEAKLQLTRHGGYITLICKSYQQLEELIEKLTQLEELGS